LKSLGAKVWGKITALLEKYSIKQKKATLKAAHFAFTELINQFIKLSHSHCFFGVQEASSYGKKGLPPAMVLGKIIAKKEIVSDKLALLT